MCAIATLEAADAAFFQATPDSAGLLAMLRRKPAKAADGKRTGAGPQECYDWLRRRTPAPRSSRSGLTFAAVMPR